MSQKKTKPYCGTKKNAPKDHHLGSMCECADSKQIRRYGLYKIDEKLANKPKLTEKERVSLLCQLARKRGTLAKLKKELPFAVKFKRVEEVKEIEKNIEKTKKEAKAISAKLN